MTSLCKFPKGTVCCLHAEHTHSHGTVTAASAAVLASTGGADDLPNAKSRWAGQPTDVALLDLLDAFHEDDVRSRSTHKTSHTHKSSHTHRSSLPPASEYSMHEREREIRRFSRPNSEWETYRYVEPPRSHSRSLSRRSGYDDPYNTRDDYRKLRERIVIADVEGRARIDRWT